MNILVSPNSMKGSLSAFEFADIVEKAFLEVSSDFRIRKIPVADGGDLTGQVLSRALNAKEINIEAEDPLGRSVLSKYAVAGECAIIEMADASGLKLLNVEELNPMKASTYGTGQLIADAIKTGCTEILLGVGGSATVDGGTGMMEALGFKFFDNDNKPLKGNGGNLEKISYIEKPHIKNISVKIICDVDNTLTGRNGAAVIFGPQKGASPDMITSLEKGLTAWGNLLKMHCGKDLLSLKG
ncbi:MAG: glycerate kinase, partial [Prolixibacteraceae bacterium]|nr:glycerate kinase [Prolixibacteraceae bacterium]